MTLVTNLSLKEGMNFSVNIGKHQLQMDATENFGGKNQGPSPKEYVLSGLCGCTGMDVVSLMRKFRVPFTAFSVSATTELTKEHPIIFEKILLIFHIEGENLNEGQIKKAIDLSTTRYCGVSAMLAKAVPIHFEAFLNKEKIHEGMAIF